jgi:hypothetical protein
MLRVIARLRPGVSRGAPAAVAASMAATYPP